MLISKDMQIEDLKDLIGRAAETRAKMYISHKNLRHSRTRNNYEDFVQTVDDFNNILKELPDYMRVMPFRRTS